VLERQLETAKHQQAILTQGTKHIAARHGEFLLPFFTGEKLAAETMAYVTGRLGEEFFTDEQPRYFDGAANSAAQLVEAFDIEVAETIEEHQADKQDAMALLSAWMDNKKLSLSPAEQEHNPLRLPEALIKSTEDSLAFAASNSNSPQMEALPSAASDGDEYVEAPWKEEEVIASDATDTAS